MKDALGNNIILSNIYGYSNNRNGFTKTVIGVVREIKDERVILNIVGIGECLYNGEMKKVESKSKHSTVSGNRLFPVDGSKINL